MSATTIYAPFTPEQVEKLNDFQQNAVWHPYTCNTNSDVLVATEAGWICPTCDYTQDWANSAMVQEWWTMGIFRRDELTAAAAVKGGE